jgi:hypothetical protein
MVGDICGFVTCFIIKVDKASSVIRWKHNREFVRSLGRVGRVLSFHAQCKAIFFAARNRIDAFV